MARRFPDGYDDAHRERVEYEIGIILQLGFPSCFLVVADFIVWAKSQGIPVGRGPHSADRHLRHDQGQGRDQGLLAGARLPVRDG